MLKKTVVTGLFIAIFAIAPLGAPPLSAAAVSVLVMEAGRPGDLSGQYSILWENGLLEVFFESGHIVTNFPRLSLDEKPADGFPDEAERDFENAQLGGMDYFLVAIVNYVLSDVSLRLFNTDSTQMIHEQKYPVTTLRNTKEEYDKIKMAVRAITAYLK
jgi:hypothetical protein